jgi:hypothetical protein
MTRFYLMALVPAHVGASPKETVQMHSLYYHILHNSPLSRSARAVALFLSDPSSPKGAVSALLRGYTDCYHDTQWQCM